MCTTSIFLDRSTTLMFSRALSSDTALLSRLDRPLEDLTLPSRSRGILEKARSLDAAAWKGLEAMRFPPRNRPHVTLPITPDELSEPQPSATKYFKAVAPHKSAVLDSQSRQWKAWHENQGHYRGANKRAALTKSCDRIRKRHGKW